MSRPFPKYAKPPVVELVLGVQFDLIRGFTSGHAGWFWSHHLGPDWKASDAPPVVDQIEMFGPPRPAPAGLRMTQVPPIPRLMVQNGVGDRLLQVQNTRFHYNWRKRDAEYPRYEPVFAEFLRNYRAFRAFVKDVARLDPVAPNQWELSYIDVIPPGELWRSPAEWANVFPKLFPAKADFNGLDLERLEAEQTYLMAGQSGRLHVQAELAFVSDQSVPALLVRTTARGPIGKDASDDALKAAIDGGHDAAVAAFDGLASDQAKRYWEPLP